MLKNYRAYDSITEWMGPARATVDEALIDGREHIAGCQKQRGSGVSAVVKRDGDRCQHLDGSPVWPSHGKTSGAVRWPEDQRLHTYHVVGVYQATHEQYIDEVEAESPVNARHLAQLNAIHNNARPVLTEDELADILTVGQLTGWDFGAPPLSKYPEFALDWAATYKVVEPGTEDSHTLKLVD